VRYFSFTLVGIIVVAISQIPAAAGNPGRGISPAQAMGIDGGLFGADEVGEPQFPFFGKGKVAEQPEPEYASWVARIWPHIQGKNFYLAVVSNHPLLQEEGILWLGRRPTPNDHRGPGYEPDRKAVCWAVRVTLKEHGMEVPMLYVIGQADVGNPNPKVALWNHAGTSAYDLKGCIQPDGSFTLGQESTFRLIKSDGAEHRAVLDAILKVFMSTAPNGSRKAVELDFDPVQDPFRRPEFRHAECRGKEALP